MPNELESWLILNQVLPVGPVKFKKLLDFFGTAEKVLSLTDKDLMQVEGIDDKTAKAITSWRNIDIQKDIEEAGKNGVKIITSFMDEYPQTLKTIYDYPPVLYVKGKLDKRDSVAIAIVGTRMITSYGKSVCEYITKELAEAGVTVVSGLARGVDSVAHKVAIEEKGRTVAVLGNGLSNHYPPENRKLEDKIVENGALISEFPMHARPDKMNFPRRNRLISGLSLGVVVIEADEKSGALITAKFAVEQGKDVFAVPGNIFSKFSKGPHKLLKNGAKLVETVDDIISEINLLKNFVKNTQKNIRILKENRDLNEESKLVLESIGCEPVHIDLLSDKTKIQIEKLSVILLGLVMNGFISELHAKNYVRKYN
ncbi:MAG: DNA protecting protein DprA [Elusimicrobia bacterium RIFOXYD2_FULL_34_15]|nr:MAG: DNA protecting protein DprA [Elusimicrobia bacterium RIFOXYD2_FULL_34_15]